MYVAVIFKCAMARVIGVPVNKVQELTDGSAFCFTQTLPRQPLSECRAKYCLVWSARWRAVSSEQRAVNREQ